MASPAPAFLGAPRGVAGAVAAVPGDVLAEGDSTGQLLQGAGRVKGEPGGLAVSARRRSES